MTSRPSSREHVRLLVAGDRADVERAFCRRRRRWEPPPYSPGPGLTVAFEWRRDDEAPPALRVHARAVEERRERAAPADEL